MFADALPPWPGGVPPFPWLCWLTVVLVTVVVVVVVAVVIVAVPPVAFTVLVWLIGFDLFFGFTFSALCTGLCLWTVVAVVFSLAAEGFTVPPLACVVWAWPCAATLDEVTE